MNIAAVGFNNISVKNNYTRNVGKSTNERYISFCSHPEYYELSKQHYVKASSYFRRGMEYGAPSNNFQDVVDIFKKEFGGFSLRPKKMLIAGIGDSQEPFSYLATIKNIIGHRPLNMVVDLHTVDIQSRPTKTDLYVNSFYDYDGKLPEFAKNSFVKMYDVEDLRRKYLYQDTRVKDNIFNYLYNTYKNPQKAKWDTRLQDAIKTYPDESFDIISANNILPYIYVKHPEQTVPAIQNIYRCLKVGGYFITDPHGYKYYEESGILDKMKKVYPGIFKKVEPTELYTSKSFNVLS